MRADRLVAILMLLQTRGRVTTAEVAAELEVSERTARRDLDALGSAGLPITSWQGRNGGWELIGGGRTDLSGLSSPEAEALFLVGGQSAVATPEVRAALRKLLRALPEPLRDRASAAASAVVVDPTGWDHSTAPPRHPPHLDAVQQAVIDGEQLELGYTARDQSVTTRVVHPLGVAAKGRSWYLVAGTSNGRRTFRVDRITAVERTGEPVVRPAGFDLREVWRTITDELDEHRAPIRARARSEVATAWYVRARLGTRVRIGPAGVDGRVEVELRGHSVESLAVEIAGFATSMEVLDPPELRDELAAIGRALADGYEAVAAASPAGPGEISRAAGAARR